MLFVVDDVLVIAKGATGATGVGATGVGVGAVVVINAESLAKVVPSEFSAKTYTEYVVLEARPVNVYDVAVISTGVDGVSTKA